MDNIIKSNQVKGVTGGTLKIIAIISMTIDHFAAAVILYMINTGHYGSFGYERLKSIYGICRLVGRIAFPIYCFLLVEGFWYTSNRKKYAIRLGIFAIISEIPFNLAFFDKLIHIQHQNVFFTLLIGLLTIMAMDYFESGEVKKEKNFIISRLIMVFGFLAATLIKVDYSGFGVIAIVIMYLFHEKKLMNCLFGACIFAWEKSAPLAFIPLYFYNGKRGRQLKYFFYAYYPIHLLIFYFVRHLILKS